ncbi:RagB/SusD family nutrient uptake outer membrane protein [Bacteroides faecichinchillae]|uniref:Starch-binding associating with outer membrane n=1 Tax=Bacteroides faecichinchillae TaxID=871325 RepID=A0A1M4THF9_9BACE|nr:RagB/SusD family nutrient uptake outer membrane protein [Bacteroides faecichinchillae]THG67974.1 RagB/SusD family nutrient uptake outer membrane protein [Bacteroides faecichinchillae]SHE43913.1 Starch-binding associating with outer membrane [Bacteroides faecichinchillae]
MNSIIKGLGIAFSYILIASSCSEISFGDNFLGNQPESSGATTEEMFSTKINAEKVLTKAYTGVPYGLPTGGDFKLGGNILESITDLCQSFRDNISDGPMKLYYNGALSANNVPKSAAYLYAGKSDWTTIRYAWLFIENVAKVPDMTDDEKNERIAEAKTLIALSYFEMMRYIGGVPWLDHAIDVNEKMEFPRITFEQTVKNIVGLLDEAINSNLKWKQDDQNDGRMTKAGAMALKFKVLQWAASPTFNSNTKWNSKADEYTCYGNYSDQRWKDAAAAGEAFFNEIKKQHGYELIQPTEDTHRARRLAYRKAYYNRGGTEILISTRKGYDVGTHSDYINQRYYTGPTLNYVDMFPWEDGSDFPEDFDWANPSKQPFFTYTNEEMVPTRDPRLYENVACPGDKYCTGTTAPVYINHEDYKDGSGFLIMKYILQENNDRNSPVQWAHTRLSEIMLGYAEVLNEVNGRPNDEAYKMVNDVRARVGLSALPKTMNHDQFLEAVLKERALELGFEEVRWFDLVRRDRQNDFKKTLYGLRSRGNDLHNPTAFTFEKVVLGDRYWKTNWDTKWYLAPIPQNEINKKYGMTQNPGW